MKIIVGSTRLQGAVANIEDVNPVTFSDVLNIIKDNLDVFRHESFSTYHVMGSYNSGSEVKTFALKTGKTVSAEVSEMYNIEDRVPVTSNDTIKIALSPVKMDGGELELTEEEKALILEKTIGGSVPNEAKVTFEEVEEEDVDYIEDEDEDKFEDDFDALEFLMD